MFISKKIFGTANEKDVFEYTLKNNKGIEVSCLNYGCAITKMMVPDRRGKVENIVLGFQDFAHYQENSIYAGVVVGRVAGRIKNAQFQLEGKTYKVAANDGQHHLHGGWKGFHHVIWEVAIVDEQQQASIQFSHTCLDGEDGYPGRLTVTITYTLNDDNEFSIHYHGQSDRVTLFNPTNHTYFNLSGNAKQDITQHILKMDSHYFLELDSELLPTGKLLDVNHTTFDFRVGRKILDGIHSDHVQHKIAGQGYDHPYVFDNNHNRKMILYDEQSGRCLTVETDAVGVVLYTGNQLPDDLDFCGVPSRPYLGLCLETQCLTDVIHHGEFPSWILKQNEVFSTVTKYTFGVENMG